MSSFSNDEILPLKSIPSTSGPKNKVATTSVSSPSTVYTTSPLLTSSILYYEPSPTADILLSLAWDIRHTAWLSYLLSNTISPFINQFATIGRRQRYHQHQQEEGEERRQYSNNEMSRNNNHNNNNSRSNRRGRHRPNNNLIVPTAEDILQPEYQLLSKMLHLLLIVIPHGGRTLGMQGVGIHYAPTSSSTFHNSTKKDTTGTTTTAMIASLPTLYNTKHLSIIVILLEAIPIYLAERFRCSNNNNNNDNSGIENNGWNNVVSLLRDFGRGVATMISSSLMNIDGYNGTYINDDDDNENENYNDIDDNDNYINDKNNNDATTLPMERLRGQERFQVYKDMRDRTSQLALRVVEEEEEEIHSQLLSSSSSSSSSVPSSSSRCELSTDNRNNIIENEDNSAPNLRDTGLERNDVLSSTATIYQQIRRRLLKSIQIKNLVQTILTFPGLILYPPNNNNSSNNVNDEIIWPHMGPSSLDSNMNNNAFTPINDNSDNNNDDENNNETTTIRSSSLLVPTYHPSERLLRFASILRWLLRMHFATFLLRNNNERSKQKKQISRYYPTIAHRMIGLEFVSSIPKVMSSSSSSASASSPSTLSSQPLLWGERPSYRPIAAMLLLKLLADLWTSSANLSGRRLASTLVSSLFSSSSSTITNEEDLVNNNHINEETATTTATATTESTVARNINNDISNNYNNTAVTLCGICHEIRSKPATSRSCGHVFCWDCIQRWIIETKNKDSGRNNDDDNKCYCPTCRVIIEGGSSGIIPLFDYEP